MALPAQDPVAGAVRLRPGPKPRLSRALIVATAVDSDLRQVTMHSIASRLGTSASALYRYFASRDELIVAAIQSLLQTSPIPTRTTGWRDFLIAEAELRWKLLTASSGLAAADPSRLESMTTQRMVDLVEGLVDSGFDLDDAVLAVDAVLDLVHDGAAQSVRLRAGDSTDAPVATHVLDRLGRYTPAVRRALEHIIDDPWAHVRRKLDLLLDGLQVRLARAKEEA